MKTSEEIKAEVNELYKRLLLCEHRSVAFKDRDLRKQYRDEADEIRLRIINLEKKPKSTF